jgi:hemoglobin
VSIYDSIGGGPAVRAAVDDFYARVLADPQLAPFFTSVGLQHLVDTLTGLGVPQETIGQIGGALAPLRGDIVIAPADELAR